MFTDLGDNTERGGNPGWLAKDIYSIEQMAVHSKINSVPMFALDHASYAIHSYRTICGDHLNL